MAVFVLSLCGNTKEPWNKHRHGILPAVTGIERLVASMTRFYAFLAISPIVVRPLEIMDSLFSKCGLPCFALAMICFLGCGMDTDSEAHRPNGWVSLASDVDLNFYALAFMDEKQGWVTGGGGLMLETKDGGGTWIPRETGVSQTLFALGLTGRACSRVGAEGTIQQSEDGGVATPGSGACSRAPEGPGPATPTPWAGAARPAAARVRGPR